MNNPFSPPEGPKPIPYWLTDPSIELDGLEIQHQRLRAKLEALHRAGPKAPFPDSPLSKSWHENAGKK